MARQGALTPKTPCNHLYTSSVEDITSSAGTNTSDMAEWTLKAVLAWRCT